MRNTGLRVFSLLLLVFAISVDLLRAAEPPPSEAEDILARGVLSDLRSPNGPPFDLRIHVRVLEVDDLGVVANEYWLEGTYILAWASPRQWREELTFSNFTQVRVAKEDRIWVKRNPKYLTVPIQTFQRTLDLRRHMSLSPNESVKSVRQKRTKGTEMKCIEINRDKSLSRRLCFDASSGGLLGVDMRLWPTWEAVYEYRDYVAVGDRIFPTLLRRFEGGSGRLILEAKVEKLATTAALDPTLFEEPDHAEAWPWCENPEAAKNLAAPYPPTSVGPGNPSSKGIARVYAIIREDGNVHDLAVVKSVDSVKDAAALKAVAKWRYKPATCGESAVPTEAIISIPF